MDTKEQSSRDWGDLLLTSQQVADILHVSLRTLQKYRDEGRLNYVRISPRIRHLYTLMYQTGNRMSYMQI